MITAITERLRVLIDTIEPTDLPQLSAELVRSLDLPPDLPEEMPIAAVAAATGVSAHTLHYYERIGLVEVARDAAVGGSMAPTRWAGSACRTCRAATSSDTSTSSVRGSPPCWTAWSC